MSKPPPSRQSSLDIANAIAAAKLDDANNSSLNDDLKQLRLADSDSEATIGDSSAADVDQSISTRTPLEVLATSIIDLAQSIRDVKLTALHSDRLIQNVAAKTHFWSLARYKKKPSVDHDVELESNLTFLGEAIGGLLDRVVEVVNKSAADSFDTDGTNPDVPVVPLHWLLFSGNKYI